MKMVLLIKDDKWAQVCCSNVASVVITKGYDFSAYAEHFISPSCQSLIILISWILSYQLNSKQNGSVLLFKTIIT